MLAVCERREPGPQPGGVKPPPPVDDAPWPPAARGRGAERSTSPLSSARVSRHAPACVPSVRTTGPASCWPWPIHRSFPPTAQLAVERDWLSQARACELFPAVRIQGRVSSDESSPRSTLPGAGMRLQTSQILWVPTWPKCGRGRRLEQCAEQTLRPQLRQWCRRLNWLKPMFLKPCAWQSSQWPRRWNRGPRAGSSQPWQPRHLPSLEQKLSGTSSPIEPAEAPWMPWLLKRS
mmetsp:Transcript_115081/g.320597  ORF Transcript_115081/g.320597 Transcript_115081/m.320597 type:complete len:234 (+) Transcript_115081:1104-1805(+)